MHAACAGQIASREQPPVMAGTVTRCFLIRLKMTLMLEMKEAVGSPGSDRDAVARGVRFDTKKDGKTGAIRGGKRCTKGVYYIIR